MQLTQQMVQKRHDFVLQEFGTTKGFARKGKQLQPIETIQGKIDMFKDLGFADPYKLARKYPGVLHFSKEYIEIKIQELRSLEFYHAHRLIIRYPKILDLSTSLLEAKLFNLTLLGFQNPRLMVMRYPELLGLSVENVNAKAKVFAQHKLLKFLEAYPIALGLSYKRLVELLLPLALMQSSPEKYLRKNVSIKIEKLICAQYKLTSDEEFESNRNVPLIARFLEN